MQSVQQDHPQFLNGEYLGGDLVPESTAGAIVAHLNLLLEAEEDAAALLWQSFEVSIRSVLLPTLREMGDASMVLLLDAA